MAFTVARATRGRAVFASPHQPLRRDQTWCGTLPVAEEFAHQKVVEYLLFWSVVVVLVCANAKGAISAKGQSADCFLHHECLSVFMLIFFPNLRDFRDTTNVGQPLPIP